MSIVFEFELFILIYIYLVYRLILISKLEIQFLK